MGKRGPKKVRFAPPAEAERRVRRARGSGATPIELPEKWRPTWKIPRLRNVKEKQFLGLTRAEKEAALKKILDKSVDVAPEVALKAIEIDNKMRGHNAPEKSEVTVSGDFWGFCEAGKSDEKK